MNIHFERITRRNREEALRLKVAEGQEGYIESVSQCLKEAGRNIVWHPVAICDGRWMVGFAMFGYFWWEYFPCGRLWLDRFMIDASCQGKGYGKTALKTLLRLLSIKYPGKDIYLSVIKGNDVAVCLYREFGFHFNGEKDINGEDVMVRRFTTGKY